MKLMSNVMIVEEIKKPTQAEFFKNLEEGSRIKFKVPLYAIHKDTATLINVTNIYTKEDINIPANLLFRRLKNFELYEMSNTRDKWKSPFDK